MEIWTMKEYFQWNLICFRFESTESKNTFWLKIFLLSSCFFFLCISNCFSTISLCVCVCWRAEYWYSYISLHYFMLDFMLNLQSYKVLSLLEKISRKFNLAIFVPSASSFSMYLKWKLHCFTILAVLNRMRQHKWWYEANNFMLCLQILLSLLLGVVLC